MMSSPTADAAAAAAAAVAQKPICTICFEDLRPAVEDLQSIPVCGHVFHELCLQQWLEYCPAGKKPTCPVCKQSCATHRPTRLYFQSTGEAAAAAAQTTSSVDHGKCSGDAEALAREVRRLELKVSSLASSLEKQQVHTKKLNDEVSTWKQLAESEEAKREEIKKEKDWVERLLLVKTEDLSRKSLECAKLEERSFGLAKELAALKLVTDINLNEEEMVKFASLGHGRNHENTVEVLSKSLALRNKSYKELMAQCNLLGRAETRTRQNLNKAMDKIKKLKTRLQEVEKVLEEKQNGTLREMKYSKVINTERQNINFVERIKPSLCSDHPSDKCETKKNSEKAANDLYYSSTSLKGTVCWSQFPSPTCQQNYNVVDLESHSSIFNKENSFGDYPDLPEHHNPSSDQKSKPELCQDADIKRLSSSGRDTSFTPKAEAWSTYKQNSFAGELSKFGIPGHDADSGPVEAYAQRNQITISSGLNDILLIDNITKRTSLATKATQAHDEAADTGNPCLGVFSPEGANKNAAKWNKKVSRRSSLSEEAQSSKNSGDLIVVGADGRGGKMKFLRTLGQSMGGEAHTRPQKKQKNGCNKSCQSQIQQFFTKA